MSNNEQLVGEENAEQPCRPKGSWKRRLEREKLLLDMKTAWIRSKRIVRIAMLRYKESMQAVSDYAQYLLLTCINISSSIF